MTNQLEKFNSLYKVQVKIPIQWGDMDAFNHVNNTKYFTYFESARIAYFEKLGVLDSKEKDNIAPILAETSCRFKWPLHYPETILVGAKVTECHSHGFLMEYGIYSLKQDKITAVGKGRIVMLQYSTHKKVVVENKLLEKIKKIEDK